MRERRRIIAAGVILVTILIGLAVILAVRAPSVDPEIPEPIPVTSLTKPAVPTQIITTICIDPNEVVDESWHLQEVLLEWNHNGINLLVDRRGTDCKGHVMISVNDMRANWGGTEFYGMGDIVITLSSTTPVGARKHVMCHELGHVLGRPHSRGDGSCMDPDTNKAKMLLLPTQGDLSAVGERPWHWEVALSSAYR